MNPNNTHADIFNGDADGIIALLQLRLAEPKESVLITGIKRDIQLVQQVDVNTIKSMTILDISLEKNVIALNNALSQKIDTLYIDHHRAGEIPNSPFLNAIIDTDANTCTSLLVNQYLDGRYVHWAIAAAFGDNMTDAAIKLSEEVGLTTTEQEQLKALGIYVNYNGYGQSVDDLHFHPADLYSQLIKYDNPLNLVAEQGSVFEVLEKAYHNDMARAQKAEVLADNECIKVVLLPDEAWSRRVSGVYGNDLANQSPNKAHAVLSYNADGVTYTVSVRAPLNNKQGADNICVQFPTGGGRAAAAGINKLPIMQTDKFIESLFAYYQS
jgi:hypothetical protein